MSFKKTVTQLLYDKYNKLLLNEKEVATELGVSETTISRMRHKNMIQSIPLKGQFLYSINEVAEKVSNDEK